MPNIKSAKKRVKVIEKKTLRNNMIKSAYKTAVRKFEEAVNAGNVEEAKVLFSEATKKIDQACSKGVIVKNTAARKKSSLSKFYLRRIHILVLYEFFIFTLEVIYDYYCTILLFPYKTPFSLFNSSHHIIMINMT